MPKKSEKLLVELAAKHNLRIIHGSAQKGQGLPEIAKELRLIVEDLKKQDALRAKEEAEKAQQALLKIKAQKADDVTSESGDSIDATEFEGKPSQ